MVRLVPIVLGLALLPACRGCQSRSVDQPPTRRIDAAPPRPPVDVTDVRRVHREALTRLTHGDKPRAEQALRDLGRALLALEARARRACLGSLGRRHRGDAPEHRAACRALDGIVALNNELANRLDPGGPVAEQLDVLQTIARRFLRRLGDSGFVNAPFSWPAGRVSSQALAALPDATEPLRGAEAVLRCTPQPPGVLLSARRGVLAYAAGRLADQPTVLWHQDCSHAQPACDRDRLWRQFLDADGGRVGPPHDTGIPVAHFDPGEPLVLYHRPDGGELLFSRDLDPWRQRLQSSGEPLQPAVPLITRGNAWARQAGTLQPWPAWLSTADKGRQLDLRIFTPLRWKPSHHLRLLAAADHGAGGLFGQAALAGGPDGYVVAFTTLRGLFVGRFSAEKRTGDRLREIRLPRRPLVDPVCPVIARTPDRWYVLAVARVGKTQGMGWLVSLDTQGRPARSPVRVRLPRPALGGCPFVLVPQPGRLVLVGLRPSKPGAATRRLFHLELTRDGRPAGRPVDHGPATELGGALPVRGGVLMLWRGAREAGVELTPVRQRKLRCR